MELETTRILRSPDCDDSIGQRIPKTSIDQQKPTKLIRNPLTNGAKRGSDNKCSRLRC